MTEILNSVSDIRVYDFEFVSSFELRIYPY